MKDELFDELIASETEGGAILMDTSATGTVWRQSYGYTYDPNPNLYKVLADSRSISPRPDTT